MRRHARIKLVSFVFKELIAAAIIVFTTRNNTSSNPKAVAFFVEVALSVEEAVTEEVNVSLVEEDMIVAVMLGAPSSTKNP